MTNNHRFDALWDCKRTKCIPQCICFVLFWFWFVCLFVVFVIPQSIRFVDFAIHDKPHGNKFYSYDGNAVFPVPCTPLKERGVDCACQVSCPF